jgi:hypothetical protein
LDNGQFGTQKMNTLGNGEAGSKQAIISGADAGLTPDASVTVTFVVG